MSLRECVCVVAALPSSAACVAVLIGLSASLVLSQFARPTSDFASVTAPVLPATEETPVTRAEIAADTLAVVA
jgi:hypothetical protein